MLYERAKQLQSQGLSAAEIERTLLGEGARDEDIKVILGSLGLGPQPQPDPSQRPLTLARQVMESRGLRLALFAAGITALGLTVYGLWQVWLLIRAAADLGPGS